MSQASSLPESKPVCSQWSRCSEVPWVKDSGIDPSLGLLLDAVVADRRRRGQALLEVAALEDAAVVGRAGPDAGEAVGLQLEAH